MHRWPFINRAAKQTTVIPAEVGILWQTPIVIEAIPVSARMTILVYLIARVMIDGMIPVLPMKATDGKFDPPQHFAEIFRLRHLS